MADQFNSAFVIRYADLQPKAIPNPHRSGEAQTPDGALVDIQPLDEIRKARRSDVVLAMRETTAASEVLKRLFDRLELVPSDAVEQIEHGATALGVTQSMGLADSRETLNAAVTRLRRARHDLQRAMFLLAVTEGESRAEIARIWRVSRQLVSRMVKEKR